MRRVVVVEGERPGRGADVATDDARRADAADPLAGLRDAFALPPDVIYLDGNSLGALQPAVAAAVRRAVDEEWGRGLIRSWNDAGWIDLPGRIAARLAPLLGAAADEVAVADSTSTNLFKALAAARRLRPDRRVVLTDDANFPTDRYVAEGLARLLGDLEVRVAPSGAVAENLDAEVAVLTLTHVDYRTGARHDAAGLTRAAHDVGALTVWDLSHSTGAVPVDLHDWDADLAVGCTYKYLNGGPGSPAYVYAARRLHDRLASPIPGWFSHARPFDFADVHEPAAGAARFLGGTPPVLSMVALEAALAVFEHVDLDELHAKARALVRRFRAAAEARLGGAVEVVGPGPAEPRGAQVSLRHPEARAVMAALLARGVIGDHRPPDLLRFGFSPLYVSHTDVERAVETLADVLATGEWRQARHRAPRTVV
jgi:kynureninase